MTRARKALTLLTLAAGVSTTATHGQSPTVDFTLSSDQGTFSSAEARGRHVALHFLLKTECPYCLRHVQDYTRRAPTVAGVQHVFIKPDAEEDVRAFSAKANAAGPVEIFRDPDAALAEQFGIPDGFSFHGQSVRFPALVLLGPDGREVFRYVGKDNTDRLPFDRFAAKMAELTRFAGVKEYNLPAGKPAIEGYDPVSYIDQNRAEKGKAQLASVYRGVTYNFATEENRARFAADPARYLPAYGGWCATAMAEGDKVEVDPTNFKVTDGRLFLFYKGWLGDAQKDWRKDESGLTRKADAAWRRIAPDDMHP